MFCTDCGKKLENDAKFCIHCGVPVNHAGRQDVGPGMQEEASLWNKVKLEVPQDMASIGFWVILGLSAVTILIGFMKWIQLEIPFMGYDGNYHLWNLVSLMMQLREWTGEEGFTVLAVVVAIPLVFWAAGIGLAAAGYIMLALHKGKESARNLFGFSSGAMGMSALTYLIMVFWFKSEINRTMKAGFGMAVGGSVIKVPVWPWLMLLAAAVSLALVLYQHSHAKVPEEVRAGSGSEALSAGEKEPEDRTQKLSQPGPLGTQDQTPGLVMLQAVSDSSKIYGCDLENPVILGRDAAGSNIVITGESSVSRKHCRFFRSGNVCYVEDLKSYNHTCVNGMMISGPTPLKRGDILKLGMLDLMVTECDMGKG